MQLLQNIWNSILDFTKLLVIPDWGSLIALLPVFMGVVVIFFFVGRIVQYRRIGPRRRRPGRVQPVTPPGVHMPGPTFAPILAAFGTFLLFAGLVFNGLILAIGLIAIILSLLYWGREGLRDYEHVAGEHVELPAVVHPGPPPGVHMPGPSFRPFLASLGVAVLFAGLVYGGWVLAVGVLFTIAALLGWLNDARKEYHHVVRADATGHLENDPPPAWPKTLLTVFALLIVAAVALNAGWFPPRTASGGTPGGSPAPGGSGGPAGSGGPGGSGGAAPGALAITASSIKFDVATLTAPADKPFTIHFDNQDAGTPHDVDVLDASGAKVVDNPIVTGTAAADYQIHPLKAGAYKFQCSVHPTMTGQLIVGS